MVYVNSKKYACESCIKGHRSSSCHHNDRPLFEIKKKGRPVSQCEKCREARQARRIHAKCTCEVNKDKDKAGDASGTLTVEYKRQGKRFIPTVPSLPNGLKDALKSQIESSTTDGSGPKQPMDSLLNPCHCKDVYKCKCRAQDRPCGSNYIKSNGHIDPAIFNDGLSALALVAACCSPASTAPLIPSSLTNPLTQDLALSSSTISQSTGPSTSQIDDYNENTKVYRTTKRKHTSPSPPTHHKKLPSASLGETASTSYRKIAPAHAIESTKVTQGVPHLGISGSLPSMNIPLPFTSESIRDREKIPDMHDRSQSEPSCCCGTRCECAGCNLHGSAAPERSSSWIDDSVDYSSEPMVLQRTTKVTDAIAHVDCGVECPTCVDHMGGIELPQISSTRISQSGSETSVSPALAAFLARAAALPPPPVAPRSSLDPTNVAIYPGLFRRSRSRTIDETDGVNDKRTKIYDDDELPLAYGLVQVPKLEECCEGRCGCPKDSCACGDACGGCCMGNEETDDNVVVGMSSKEPSRHIPTTKTTNFPKSHIPPPTSAGGCCDSS